MRWGAGATGGVLLAAAGGLARANGAFPDSVGILVPPDRPQEITLSTNFGLITTEDDGKNWTWSCEQPIASQASLYQLGPAPLNRLYTLSEHGLLRSDDLSCTWAPAGGMGANALLTDFFADPTDPARLFAVGLPYSTQIMPKEVYESRDGGQSLGLALYHGSPSGDLTGVESARGDPRIVYVGSYDTPGPHPRLVKSTDGGASWAAPMELEASIGANIFRIIAVDPVDAQKIFLLVTEGQAQSLAISTDGGVTFTTPVHFAVALTAFARLASGTILVAGLESGADGNPTGVGFRSSDGGQTFVPWAVPRLRALAERAGKVYGAADNFIDGFALAVSTDEGMTFRPLMTFIDVSSVRPCALDACLASCRMLAMLAVWPDSVCNAGAPPPAPPVPAPSGGTGGGCALRGEPSATTTGDPVWWLGLVGISLLRRRGQKN